jgi:hypothetical protein
MSFLYPYFLFALLAVAIPIIIHLFNFKRFKTIYFSNVELIKLIKKESRKKSKLKQLVILASRILAIVALVLAFSGPFVPLSDRTKSTTNQVVAVFIDNSFSMKAEGENGQLLEQAKLKAIEIANAYQMGTQFIVLTCDFLPQHKFLLSKEQFIKQITEINESPQSPEFSEIYHSVFQGFSELPGNAEKILYLISDFQKGKTGFETLKPDSSVFTYLIPLRANQSNNLLIDSCWFEVPGRKIGQSEKLFVAVRNLSDQAYQNIPVRLSINDTLKAVANIGLTGREKTILELNYTNNSVGIQLCKAELDDYPILYDNSWFMSYQVRGKMQALGLTASGSQPDYLKSMFLNDELISYDESAQNNFQISGLKNYQCVFLINNQQMSTGLGDELVNFVNEGGSLAVFPARNPNLASLNEFYNKLCGKYIQSADTGSMGISEINYSHELYRDVFKKQESEGEMPVIKGYFNYTRKSGNNDIPLLKFRNGQTALSVSSLGKGKIYLFAFPLDRGNFNFIRHVLFLPTIYNIILNSGEQQRYASTIGNEDPIILNQTDIQDKITVVHVKTNTQFATQVRTIGANRKQLNLDDMPKEAGHYLIMDGNRAIQPISYNYTRNESEQVYYNEDNLKEILSGKAFNTFKLIDSSDINFSQTLQELNSGKQFWKFFLILAIFFAFCEMAVIRFWKS